jgi:membrane protein YdbS with pleckstrin-like domain
MNLLSDILKENGIYSIKRVTAFIVMILVLILAVIIVVASVCFDKKVASEVIDIFKTLLTAAYGIILVTEVGKKFITKTEA